MAEQTTLKTLTDIIIDQLGVDADAVTPEADIISDLGADSLDQVELIMAIEEEFEIEIQDEEAEKVKTVKAIVELIDSKK